MNPNRFSRAVRVVDPHPMRYRCLEDYEADVRDGVACKRAIMPLARAPDGTPMVNPEWLQAPLELGIVLSDSVLEI